VSSYLKLKTEPKLDYLITGYWVSSTKHHLKLARELGIKVFIINADIRDTEKEDIGKPRGKYHTWIGHMVPDDQGAAMELAETLINYARQMKNKPASDDLHVYSFSGKSQSTVTLKRNTGFRNQVASMPGVKSHEKLVLAEDRVDRDTKVDRTRKWVAELINNASEMDVIIAGGQDEMWGAMQGVAQAGKTPGKDVFIGGFDWKSDSIKAIADGRISASMFGHFMEGAWALLLVYDYHQGIDFADDIGTKILTPMTALTPDNYERYKTILNNKYWQDVDFKQLSKKYNPALKAYNFNINQFIQR
jgi:ABC-type sugar transport system substrate-binding protein